jgi:hypothetical protein
LPTARTGADGAIFVRAKSAPVDFAGAQTRSFRNAALVFGIAGSSS